MPMDATDSKLLKGIVAFAVLGLVVYYYPFSWPLDSYKAQSENLEQTREVIVPTKQNYERIFGPTNPQVWDPNAMPIEISQNLTKITVADRKAQYEEGIRSLQKLIKEREESSRMKFADWTVVPESERNPGFYFAYKWEKLRIELDKEARQWNVEIADKDIGFKRFVVKDNQTMSKARAEELLRELDIAEKIIRLAIKAKKEQEDEERKRNLKPEAFMRIITVTPQDSDKAGPYRRERNEAYKPEITDPRDPRSKKFIVKELPKFIQEYPVEILLQCDVNAFMKFLRSVRTPGQFLVIRNLQIVSPFLGDSQRDKSDLREILGDNPEKQMDYKDEHLWVRISAAGMDFFEPEERKGALAGTTEDVPEMFRHPPKGQKPEATGN
ncbi:MAG: hypothetical protein HY291_06280 [Planctomycetes bacterium]|nr:hypothetical protein [Planctomycetota bacterium]